MIGKTLAHYTVIDKIGEGGMGEVYRARDTTLDREVALKVLPPNVVADPERIARFEREAKVLASLNHSGIASIYGFHEQDGIRFLAMELVPGLDLSQRLLQAPMSVEEILPIAARLADAMEYAHERGIVHRDLKPANIKVPPGGVKVLDFGLAKAFALEDAAGNPTSSPTMLPTITTGGTVPGMIMGTAAYMSPEQARGHIVDRRTDIWAFGCVLYEMLTGKLLFPGSTVSDTIAAVLRADIDFSALPDNTPESVKFLLERCLDRDPKTRLRDIGEARVVLTDPTASTAMRIVTAEPEGVPTRKRLWPLLGVGAVALVAGLLGGRLITPTVEPEPPLAFRFEVIDSLHVASGGSLALSPNGKHLVYLAGSSEPGMSELVLRGLDQESGHIIQGSRGAKHAFWSADGTHIGFFVDRGLYKVGINGEAASQIAVVPDTPLGGAWNAHGTILIGTESMSLFRVADTGGQPVAQTTLVENLEDAHAWPFFLPDGDHFIFLGDGSTDEGHRVTIGSLSSPEIEVIKTAVRSPIFPDPGGALLYAENNQLLALPFDMAKREITGPQVLIQDAVQPIGTRHELPVTLSHNGVLALQSGTDASFLTRIPLDGSTPEPLTDTDRYRNPRVSPDGQKLAFENQVSGNERLIWVQDLERGSRTLISVRGVTADSPAWSPDGEWIYFGMDAESRWQMFRKRVQGGAPPELLGGPSETKGMDVQDISPDGRWALVTCNPNGDMDLFLGALDETPPTWTAWCTTPGVDEEGPRFSPNSQWIAYESDASGRVEVYVAPVEGGPALRQFTVSVDGGTDPAWSPDGSKLYYRDHGGNLRSVELTATAGQITVGSAQTLVEIPTLDVGYLRNTFDVTPDGTAVIAFVPATDTRPVTKIRTGWRAW